MDMYKKEDEICRGRFKHRTLEERVAEYKGQLNFDGEFDWGFCGKGRAEIREKQEGYVRCPECGVCKRIELIQQGKNPYFVRELQTGYVVIGDYQRFKGYTLFLCKEHATELHFLEEEFRYQFLKEMSIVAEAVYRAFGPEKLNYELLGVGNFAHMHWHIFPRNAGDTPLPGPVWKLMKEEMYAEQYIPTDKELEELRCKLDEELEKLLSQ